MRRLPRPAVTNSVISSLSSLQFAPTDMAREKHSLSEHTTLATCSTKSVPSPSSGSGESGPYEPGPEDASSCWRAPHGGLSIRHALLACLEGGTARAVACEADTLMTPLVAPTAAMQAKSLGHRVRTTGAGLACALADDNGVADRPFETVGGPNWGNNDLPERLATLSGPLLFFRTAREHSRLVVSPCKAAHKPWGRLPMACSCSLG